MKPWRHGARQQLYSRPLAERFTRGMFERINVLGPSEFLHQLLEQRVEQIWLEIKH